MSEKERRISAKWFYNAKKRIFKPSDYSGGFFIQKEIVNFTTTRIWFFVIKLYMCANK